MSAWLRLILTHHLANVDLMNPGSCTLQWSGNRPGGYWSVWFISNGRDSQARQTHRT